MEFDPAFALLKKITAGIQASSSKSDTIDNDDVVAAAKYLGMDWPQKLLAEELESSKLGFWRRTSFCPHICKMRLPDNPRYIGNLNLSET